MRNRSPERPAASIPWLLYVEYKSRLLAIAQVKQHEQKDDNVEIKPSSDQTRFTKFIAMVQDPRFFLLSPEGTYDAWLNWHNDKNLFISISLKKNLINIRFETTVNDELENLFVNMQINIEKNEIKIRQYHPQKPWTAADQEDIVNDFRELFTDSDFQHEKASVVAKQKSQLLVKTLSQADFASIISANQKHNLPTRLHKPMQAMYKPLKDEFVFWLNWNEKNLKVTVENSAYRSFVFCEKKILKDFYHDNQFTQKLFYYMIKIIDIAAEDVFNAKKKAAKEANIKFEDEFDETLSLISTLDAVFFEILHLNASLTITGSEALGIVKEFIKLIQPQNVFLQDASMVTVKKPGSNAEENEIHIPLRLSGMLTTGDTWYGKHLNVKLLDANHVASGWRENITLSQCSQTFYQAAKELRELPFASFIKYWEWHRPWLFEIAKKYYPHEKPSSLTGKDIFAAIFNKDNHKTESGFSDLYRLYNIIGWGVYDNRIIEHDESKLKINMTNQVPQIKKGIISQDYMNNRFKSIMFSRMYGLFAPDKENKPTRTAKNTSSENNKKRQRMR